MKTYLQSISATLGLLLTGGSLFGQVVNDPYYVTGSDAIDPPGRMEVTLVAPGSTDKSTLTALNGFGAVQDFGGFTGNASVGSDRVITFSDTDLPAIQFTFDGSVRTSSTATLNNGDYATSRTAYASALRLQPWGGAGNTITLQIDFGKYADGTFAQATTGQGVSAVGFTLSGQYDMLTEAGISITYLDADGVTLSSQTLAQSSYGTATIAGYTGYQISEGQSLIASVIITYEAADGGPTFGFDDLGFTEYQNIPEPSQMSLGILGLIMMLFYLVRSRCRRA